VSKGTLAFLLALVVVLGFLWRAKQGEIARGGPALGEYPLAPGLSSARVSAVRVEHLERSFQMKLERDAAGRWFLTDPIAYPAQTPLVRTLIAMLEGARGEPAPEADPRQVGLDPPQVVLELTQLEDGGPRTIRIELGKADVDTALIYARAPGHPAAADGGTDVFRTTRALANTLDRNPDDYRERRATGLAVNDVLAVRRRGTAWSEEEGRRVDLVFDALLGPDGWKRAAPTVTLDPNAMALFVRGATDLTIESFADDSPTDLSRWGLDPPTFTVELQGLSGTPTVLAFGTPVRDPDAPVGSLTWFCQRQGYAHVWEARTRDVELLTQPASLFYDQHLVRMLRTDVARLELEGAGGRRVLARSKHGWEVWQAESESGAESRSPGSTAAIEEALALLEKLELVEHFPDEAFVPCEPPASFLLELHDGTRFSGRVGGPTRDPRTGGQGRQFLREGDEVLALVDAALLELCERPLDTFRSRKMHQIQESQVRMIELEAGGKTFSFVNNGDNVWNPRGQSVAAPDDFVQALDGLLNLAATRWLTAAPAGQELLAVRVHPLLGDTYAFRFLRAGDGGTVCEGRDGQIATVEPAVVERLLRLF